MENEAQMTQLREELADLYDEIGQQLFRCALSVTRSSDLAEDAVHDAFAKAFRLKTKPNALKAYMFRAVRNSAVDIIRQRSRTVQPAAEDFFDMSAVLCHSSTNEFALESIVSGMVSLSDDERETVMEHLVAGLTLREIAELRSRPIGTIATWYRRGIEKLRRRLVHRDE